MRRHGPVSTVYAGEQLIATAPTANNQLPAF